MLTSQLARDFCNQHGIGNLETELEALLHEAIDYKLDEDLAMATLGLSSDEQINLFLPLAKAWVDFAATGKLPMARHGGSCACRPCRGARTIILRALSAKASSSDP